MTAGQAELAVAGRTGRIAGGLLRATAAGSGDQPIADPALSVVDDIETFQNLMVAGCPGAPPVEREKMSPVSAGVCLQGR